MKNSKIKLQTKPSYQEIIYHGTYDGHNFRIQDTNGEIFINFIDHYKEDDIEEFNKIKEQIKSYYIKHINHE